MSAFSPEELIRLDRLVEQRQSAAEFKQHHPEVSMQKSEERTVHLSRTIGSEPFPRCAAFVLLGTDGSSDIGATFMVETGASRTTLYLSAVELRILAAGMLEAADRAELARGEAA